jgi:CBS domain-containing protein
LNAEASAAENSEGSRMMKTIADILASKGSTVHTISPEALVLRAVESMVENNIGALVVMDNAKVCGMVSERDYLRKIVVKGRRSHDTRVKEIMTSEVVYTRPEQSIREAMAIMTQRRARHLPVVDGSKLLGLVSIGDLAQHVAADQQVQINILHDYIADNYPR